MLVPYKTMDGLPNKTRQFISGYKLYKQTPLSNSTDCGRSTRRSLSSDPPHPPPAAAAVDQRDGRASRAGRPSNGPERAGAIVQVIYDQHRCGM